MKADSKVIGGLTLGLIVYIVLVVIGWVYYTKINNNKKKYSSSTQSAALVTAILGLFPPLCLFNVVPPILYAAAEQKGCDNDNQAPPVSTLARDVKKQVRFQEPPSVNPRQLHMPLQVR